MVVLKAGVEGSGLQAVRLKLRTIEQRAASAPVVGKLAHVQTCMRFRNLNLKVATADVHLLLKWGALRTQQRREAAKDAAAGAGGEAKDPGRAVRPAAAGFTVSFSEDVQKEDCVDVAVDWDQSSRNRVRLRCQIRGLCGAVVACGVEGTGWGGVVHWRWAG